MPTVWFALKRSFDCKSEPSDVFDPKGKSGSLSSILTRKTSSITRSGCSSGCSRSIENLKDVINGSKRHLYKSSSCSPKSIGSNEFHNPIAHEVIFSNSKCELKITGCDGFHENGDGGGVSSFVGAISPSHREHPTMQYYNPSFRTSVNTPPRKSHHSLITDRNRIGFGGSAVFGTGGICSNGKASNDADSNGSSIVNCHKCGEQFRMWETLEAHHLSKHAVTEIVEGDSSRKIVEIICRSSWPKSENNCGRIERVLKVHNMQRTLARFEEYRETVKVKASKLSKKHPRCLADGNELLRFYGATVECSLGMNNSSSLCTSEKCSVCRIIRHGFSTKKELNGGIGVFTTSTSGRAFECIETYEQNRLIRKALIICRVIAGRVHRPLENSQELGDMSGFDSLAGKMGQYSNIEELYLLNPRALLPCFVVICKP